MTQIPFNKPYINGDEILNLNMLLEQSKFSGDGEFTLQCRQILEEITGSNCVLLTTSCTHGLEMAALLSNISPGDEVIMPSYTFVSTANPFVLRGAKIKFVDIRPETMNMDESLIEAAISPKTKAIVPVHYGGVSCQMDAIMLIAKKNNIIVIEDAAQGIGASFKGQPLGTIGHLGAFSFHDTKNIHCGEGGTIIINEHQYIQRAEYIREKGTNRQRFLRGEKDKYSWVSIGSSYLPNEISMAFLLSQLGDVQKVTNYRLKLWDIYYKELAPLEEEGLLELPKIPEGRQHNGHMFFIKLKNIEHRQHCIDFLKKRNINAVFHYIPLHSSEAGKHFGEFVGKDNYTTVESERLLRLPMYFELQEDDVRLIVKYLKEFLEYKE